MKTNLGKVTILIFRLFRPTFNLRPILILENMSNFYSQLLNLYFLFFKLSISGDIYIILETRYNFFHPTFKSHILIFVIVRDGEREMRRKKKRVVVKVD